MNIEEVEINDELEVNRARGFAYWEDQLMKCALGEKAWHDPKTIMRVLHERFGWELPDSYEGDYHAST